MNSGLLVCIEQLSTIHLLYSTCVIYCITFWVIHYSICNIGRNTPHLIVSYICTVHFQSLNRALECQSGIGYMKYNALIDDSPARYSSSFIAYITRVGV